MQARRKILLKISWYTGIIPLTGGWLIFLIWLAGRYVNASDFAALTLIGFFWMAVCFWIALAGLLLLFICVLSNLSNLHIKMLLALFGLLSNIPSVIIILIWHGQLENRVFVKLVNNTRYEDLELKLEGAYKKWELGSVDDASSIVFNYDPPYSSADGRFYQKPDTLKLIIKNRVISDTIGFPTLRLGDCRNLTLDSNLKIQHP